MSALSIRPATIRDLRALVRLEEACFPEPWNENLLRSEIGAGPSRRYTVAVLGRKIVGCLGLMTVDDEAHVNTLSSDPAHRGQGVATRLLLDGIDACLADGIRHLTLEVAASNLAAQGLYRKFGLAPVGVRRGYYAGGEDGLVMWVYDLDRPDEIRRREGIARSLFSGH